MTLQEFFTENRGSQLHFLVEQILPLSLYGKKYAKK